MMKEKVNFHLDEEDVARLKKKSNHHNCCRSVLEGMIEGQTSSMSIGIDVTAVPAMQPEELSPSLF